MTALPLAYADVNVQNDRGMVEGVIWTDKAGKEHKEMGAVILASGGYAAGVRREDSLLYKVGARALAMRPPEALRVVTLTPGASGLEGAVDHQRRALHGRRR